MNMASRLSRVICFSAGLTSSFVAFNTLDKLISTDENYRPISIMAPSDLLAAKMKNFLPLGKDYEPLKLEQVQVITRHGARTPFKLIPNIEPATWEESRNEDLPHTMIDFVVRTADGGGQPQSAIDNAYLKKDRLKGGSLVGQLTQVGQQEMYDLGRSIKSRYIDELGFLPAVFNHEDVQIRTTNILRTVKSARCVLAGMYGGTTLKTPITMITSTNEHEFLYPNYYFCKSLKHWAEIAWSTAAEVPGITEFCATVGEKLGLEGNAEELSVIALEDNIRARIAHGHPVPSFLMELFDEIDDFAVKVQLRVIAGAGKSRNIIRASVGNFVENICTQLEDKVQGQSNYKMLLYSAHDTTLMALLQVFGVYDHAWPKFSADIKIELYSENAGKWYVKVLYNDQEKTMPGCKSSFCSLERFLEIVEPYRVKDWDAECGVKGDYKKETFAIGTI